MINYSSYNDVWGITPNISENKTTNDNCNKRVEHFTSHQDNDTSSNDTSSNHISSNDTSSNVTSSNDTSSNDTSSNHISSCMSIEHIFKCKKCLKKLKKELLNEQFITEPFYKSSIETFSTKIDRFNTSVKNVLLFFCDNKEKKFLLLFFLITLFIILSFYYVKDRGVKEGDVGLDLKMEALAEATRGVEFANLKYLKENFIIIPKNMINFNPSL